MQAWRRLADSALLASERSAAGPVVELFAELGASSAISPGDPPLGAG